jgi:hypothetical protein
MFLPVPKIAASSLVAHATAGSAARSLQLSGQRHAGVVEEDVE